MSDATWVIWKNEVRFFEPGPSNGPVFRLFEGRVSLQCGLEALVWRDSGQMFFVIWRNNGALLEFGGPGCHNGPFWASVRARTTEQAFSDDPGSPFIDLPDFILDTAQEQR